MIDAAIIERQALSLDIKERGRLASVLLKSLDEPENELSPAEWERLWAKECQRRVAEMESGEVVCIPWKDVLAEARTLVK